MTSWLDPEEVAALLRSWGWVDVGMEARGPILYHPEHDRIQRELEAEQFPTDGFTLNGPIRVDPETPHRAVEGALEYALVSFLWNGANSDVGLRQWSSQQIAQLLGRLVLLTPAMEQHPKLKAVMALLLSRALAVSFPEAADALASTYAKGAELYPRRPPPCADGEHQFIVTGPQSDGRCLRCGRENKTPRSSSASLITLNDVRNYLLDLLYVEQVTVVESAPDMGRIDVVVMPARYANRASVRAAVEAELQARFPAGVAFRVQVP